MIEQQQRAERRLAAILAADVVGYSRLMGLDEAGTLTRLKALRRELIEPTIAAHHGRTVKLMGDGALVEFASVVDAVACAVEIQRGVAERHAQVPQDRRLAFRIGINLGDVIIDGDDIYGNGVNVAARLEGLSEPGGVVLSGTVYDHVKNKLDGVGFQSLGEHRVKNIADPVRVYRVLLDSTAAGAVAARWWRPLSRSRLVLTAVAVAIAVAWGAAIWLRPWTPPAVQGPLVHTALPLPDKPSIAVLPFTNMGGDPEQEYFADGMTEDLITDLSKISGLFVIARNSTFAYKGRPVDVRQVAEELGVRYVLEGSVRRTGDKVRINAQLIDAASAGHLWAERYDGTFGDIFELQDQVVRTIVAALAANLPGLATPPGQPPTQTAEPEAYDAFLRGWAHYRLGTPDDLAEAVSYLEKAVALDPEYSRAYALLAAVYSTIIDKDRSTGTTMWSRRLGMPTDGARVREERYLTKALEHPDSLALQAAAARLSRQGHHREALAQAERAVALDPSDPVSHQAMAAALIYAGRPAEAADHIERAIRLDPLSPHDYLYWLGLAQFGMGRFDDAAKTLTRAAQSNPDDDRSLIVLAAAYGHLGRVQEAEAAIGEANEIRVARQRQLGSDLRAGIDFLLVGPYTLQDLDLWPFALSADRERLREGLVRAGVPEAGTGEDVSPLEVPGAITVDAAAAKALFDRGARFVDVRGEASWNDGHIPGAIHLDLKTDFTEEALSRAVRRDEEVVLYCMGPRCLMSSEACRQAVAWGFPEVYYFREGFPAWKAAGYPVAAGGDQPSQVGQ